jgi:hexosaminidase
MRVLFLLSCFAGLLGAQTNTALWVRGYSVIPTPQKVELAQGDVQIDSVWVVDPGKAGPQSPAVKSLLKDALELHSLKLRTGAAPSKAIRLAVAAGTVVEKDPELAKQAYKLTVDGGAIRITGNTEQGLFYGVQTLVQLMKRDAAGRVMVPKGTIEDWPKLELRFLHWDTKHHQDRMENIKRLLDWSARFKANMIGFELEDKFAYRSHPEIGAPGAFTPAQMQEIVNYGLERYIQVVPQVQAPAHMGYVLKHPEFANVKADGNNYQSDMCNPKTNELIFSMFDDLIKATKGVNYFFASTDEVYYAGLGGMCKEPYNPANRSLKWVEFATQARDFLHARGRRMLAWVEYPLLPPDVEKLPPDIIDAIVGNPENIKYENKIGMRQFAYVSMQGEEHLFPNNLTVEGPRGTQMGRVEDAARSIASGRHSGGNPLGVFGAAWSDSGLHNETFWLGWSTVAQYAWNPTGAPVDQHVAEFIDLFYGPRTTGMVEVYRDMQRQAQTWSLTWDRVPSRVRGPGYGNSRGKGVGTGRTDMVLSAPPLPQLPDLKVAPAFGEKYAKWIDLARVRTLENEKLIASIQSNFSRADRNRYSLEVFLTLARFMGHHWNLLTGLADAESQLKQAEAAAATKNHAEALSNMVAAYKTADALTKDLTKNFEAIKTTWEKAHDPKGRPVDGKQFLHVLDDVKDHFGDRRPDLSYMIAPEQAMNLEGWQKDLLKIIRQYAADNKVPLVWEGEQPWE